MLKPLPCVGSPGLWRRCPHRRAAQRPHCIPVSRPQRPPALAACSRLTGPLKEVIHHCCHGPERAAWWLRTWKGAVQPEGFHYVAFGNQDGVLRSPEPDGEGRVVGVVLHRHRF
jgi:hypothetical protein